MAKNILQHAHLPANAARFAVGLTVAAGVAFAGSPAMATGPQAQTNPSQPLAVAAPAAPASAGNTGQVSMQSVLQVAESQIGVKENAAGGGTPYHSWYMSSPRAMETLARDGGGSPKLYANAPWCAMFVSWVGEKAGARASIGWDAYTVTYADWFKANKRWGDVAKPGAVVFYDWNGGKSTSGVDHVGLVKKDNGDGTITAIEGNTGNGKVEERVRPKAHVTGYGYPEYKA
ncbi:CHAP domain-containing protein [Nonomuraea sp. NPDC048916]|uniref:CHAP domain-containing protein n=1 Tax=Nonomuraea sp. NPDC048916 TaxID=3154232 RepID=UPI0033EB379F